MTDATPYANLSPDALLDAVEAAGWRCDGSLLALNSYENRVYQIGQEETEPIVGKFYRPDRWSDAQILEEHAFTAELLEHEMSVVAPLHDDSGATLFHQGGFRFALFPRQGGYPPDIENAENLTILGRSIARIHAVGRAQPFESRIALTAERYGHDSRTLLLERGFIPDELIEAYASISTHLLARIDQLPIPATLRIHGDCHLGNVLWRDDIPHFVDFDDAMMGPAIQDLWMLLSGDREDRTRQLGKILDGYEDFMTFDAAELRLVEALRALRIMYHAAWIARRWDDPAFPLAFPWFNTIKYWSEHVLDLREQLAELDEPPLAV